jgi:RNA polymerase sigma factor (sigma-70 family)
MVTHADTELVIRLREDDVEAFNALYWKYHQAVYANIFKLLKEPESTKDILQDVFVALWEKRSTLDSGQSVSGWLFVTSYNKSVSYLKKLLKVPVAGNELKEELHPAEEPDLNVKEVQLQLLEAALGRLSPQKKKVFELCKLQGKSYEETAKELNISRHTVKEYLSAAIASVKEYIKERPHYLISIYCPFLLLRFLS